MMPKRPVTEDAPTPKPAVKRAPRRAPQPKMEASSPFEAMKPPTVSAPIKTPPPAASRSDAGLSRRSLMFAGVGVFAGGAALGLGAAKLATPEGAAAAGRKIVASAPVWFVEEEPLPSEIHVPPARVVEIRPPEPKPTDPRQLEPKLAESKPQAAAPVASPPASVPPAVQPPPVAAAPRAATRPAPALLSGDGRPTVAIIIDDVGVDRARGERVLALPPEVTIAFMTYADGPRQWGERARAAGHEYLVHVPMQPAGSVDPGPQALLSGLDPDELRRRLRWGLDRWDGYVGANNHMGSRFTESASGMSLVMEEMRARNLLFLDSRTSPKSVAGQAAHQAAVPFAERNIFLDNEATPAGLQRQLAALDDLARKRGQAIAIGHPHDATLAALAAWVPTAQARGIRVVPLTKVMHHA